MSEVYHIRAGNRNVVIRCTNTFITGTILASRVKKKKNSKCFQDNEHATSTCFSPPRPHTHTHYTYIIFKMQDAHAHSNNMHDNYVEYQLTSIHICVFMYSFILFIRKCWNHCRGMSSMQ